MLRISTLGLDNRNRRIDKAPREKLTYRMHRSGIAQPGVVHLFDVCCARSVEERLGGCWVVSFDAERGQGIVCELKALMKQLFVGQSPKSWWTTTDLTTIANSYLAASVVSSRMLTLDFCWRTSHEPKFCCPIGARRLKAFLARCIMRLCLMSDYWNGRRRQ